MRLARSTVYTLALAATFGIGACGGGDDDDGGGGVIEGEHHTYVVDSVEIPDNADATDALGFDLDGDIGGDTEVDNQLGSVLTTLAQVGGSGLNLQQAIDESVAQGDILLLADIQATDLAQASNAGVRIYFGENPNPPACTNPDDVTTCGQHLQGGASFDVMSGSLADGVSGDIVGGRFTGGPGSLNIQISFSGTLINAHLIRAFAEVTGISADGFTSARLGGAITQADLDGEVMPAVQTTISEIITRDCTGAGSPPVSDGNCGCTGTGASLQSIFGTEMADDCQLDLPELKMNGVVQSVLKPDIDTDEDGVKDALSIGVGASAVGAVYTPPSS